jgi:LysM repeat protein
MAPVMDETAALRRPRSVARTWIAPAVVLAAISALTACGTTDEASKETLPPMRTTTSTSSPPTTTIPEGTRFYTVQSGDTLAAIAASFQVTVQSIVDLNGLDNPDDIQAGQTLEIPSGIIVVEELPDVTTVPTG